jgi:dihydroflavonol-4-reductase
MEAVLKAASDVGIKRLIYTSSLTTIGFPGVNEERLADERDHYQAGFLADNGYYEAKSAMEKMALEAAQAGNDIVILNPTLVLGPGDTKISSSQVLVLIARGQALAVPEGIINIADVRDVAQAHISAAEIGDSGERYILGGENYSIKEAAARIAITAGVRPPTLTIPTWLIDLYINLADWIPWIDFPPFQLRAYEYWQGYDTKRAQQQLNLKTRSLEETALDSIKWFSDQGVLS